MNWAAAAVVATPAAVSALALALAWLNARVRLDGCRDCGMLFSQPGTADPPATTCPACVALYAQAEAAGQHQTWATGEAAARRLWLRGYQFRELIILYLDADTAARSEDRAA